MSFLTQLVKSFKPNTNKTSEVATDADTIQHLLNHPIFQEFQVFNTVKIDTIAIADPLKRRMARAYLKILYGHMDNAMRDVVKDYVAYCGNPVGIGTKLRDSISDAKKTALNIGVPSLFIDQYEPKAFSTVSITINAVIEIHQNQLYNSLEEEMSAYLDIVLMSMRMTLETLEDLINSMNGELHHALVGSVFDTD